MNSNGRNAVMTRVLALLLGAVTVCGCSVLEDPGTTGTTAPPTTTTSPPTTLGDVEVDAPLGTVDYPEVLCEPVDIPDTNFASGRPDLLGPSDALALAAANVVELRSLGVAVVLRIVGHTDSRPTTFPGGNQGLSEARARSVRDFLVGVGVDPAWIVEVAGVADREPIPGGDDVNRRVEVIPVCPPKR
jgi:outer membrane protein OmpA-like peptidoglycan-associated protein